MRPLPALLIVLALAGCARSATGPSALADAGRFSVLAPASGSRDLLAMFTAEHEAKWAESRSQIRAFQFYQQNLRPSCATCGVNTLANFLGVVPGGAFAWLTSRGIDIGVEAGAVKEHTCSGRELADVFLNDISPVYASGAVVSYVAMDEPFTAGMSERGGGGSLRRCELSLDRVVAELRQFTDTVHASRPEIRVGLIEAYPYFGVLEIQGFITALIDAGARPAFFRLDYDQRHRANLDANAPVDLQNLKRFLRDRGVEFQVIVTGMDGSASPASVASALALANEVGTTVGRPDLAVFQDWSSDRVGQPSVALNLPESVSGTLTWLLNNAVSALR